MTTVMAGITISVDGYVTGPDDGPGRGLGTGGERLHYWVFGGPWAYDAEPTSEPTSEATGEDRAWLDESMSGLGAVITGRRTYEASERWGDQSPWGVPVFVLTRRPEDQPEGGDFTFVADITEAVERAKETAGDKVVHVMGGAETVRQALAGGHVDELSIIVAPLVLGGGKRLFDGFERRVELEHRGVRQSPYATFIDYRVLRS